MQQQKKAAKFIGCLTYRVRFRWRCHPMAVRLLPPDSAAVLSDPSGSARSLHSSFSGSPLPTSRLFSLSCLPPSHRLSHFSESASGERPRGSKVLPCPPRPQPLTTSEISDDRRLWHISGQPPSGFGPKEKVHSSRFEEDSWGKIARHKAVMG